VRIEGAEYIVQGSETIGELDIQERYLRVTDGVRNFMVRPRDVECMVNDTPVHLRPEMAPANTIVNHESLQEWLMSRARRYAGMIVDSHATDVARAYLKTVVAGQDDIPASDVASADPDTVPSQEDCKGPMEAVYEKGDDDDPEPGMCCMMVSGDEIDSAAMAEHFEAMDIEMRRGRGVRNEQHQRFLEERERELLADVPEEEREAALMDDSGDSITETSESSRGEDDSASSPSDEEDEGTTEPGTGPMSMHEIDPALGGNTTASEMDECVDTSDTWDGSDPEYQTESAEPSEEIVSDADGEPPSLEEFFEMESWNDEEIAVWSLSNSAAASAVSRSKLAHTQVMPEGIDARSGTTPSVLAMIDAGAFKHMIGTGMMHLAVNVRFIRPHPVLAADGGRMYLDQECDIILNGCSFTGCLVNPHIRTTLLSEGWMFMHEGWNIQN